MKSSILTAAIAACAVSFVSRTHAFATPPMSSSIISSSSRQRLSSQPSLSLITSSITSSSSVSSSFCLNMFSGGALDVEEEEDDEKRTQIEQMAKAMGMTVEEYQLGMNARLRMEDAINNLRVVGGDVTTMGVSVERDGNMPPRHLVVTVTDAGKAMGKAKLEKNIVDALKSASDKSAVGRNEAQKDMMKYISDSMKKMGIM